jgi:hypothetical protein
MLKKRKKKSVLDYVLGKLLVYSLTELLETRSMS